MSTVVTLQLDGPIYKDPIIGMEVAQPKLWPLPGQVLLGYKIETRKDLQYFKTEGWVAAVMLLLCCWPCLFIPFLMGNCYRERQVPVYGTPEQARAVNYVMQQGVLQPPVAQAPTLVPMGGTVTYQVCIAVVATDESNPDGKPPVGYPVPSAPQATTGLPQATTGKPPVGDPAPSAPQTAATDEEAYPDGKPPVV